MANTGQTGSKNISETQIEEALRKHGGIVAHAAKALRCSRQNLNARISNSEHLLGVQQEIAETTLDIAEGVINAALKKGDARTAAWLLDRRGKARGYGRQMQIIGGGGGTSGADFVVGTVALTPEDIENARRRYIDDGD